MADNTSVNSSDIRKGEETLLSLIYPRTKEDMSESQAAEFAIAAAEQAEFSSADSGRTVTRETVGDISITYGDAPDAATVYGKKISPAALSRLMRCGLLSRWI